MFESVKKILRGGTEMANNAQAQEVLGGYPVIQNVSGLPVGTTITSIGETAVIVPKIGGVIQSPAVVMECTIEGSTTPRPIFLSSFLRKANLEDDFKGLLATVKDADTLTNAGWVEALKGLVPFHVSNSEQLTRKVARRDGTGEQEIRTKVLTLSAGKAAKPAGDKKP